MQTNENKKTIGILITTGSVLLCGCPGLALCIFSSLGTIGLSSPQYYGTPELLGQGLAGVLTMFCLSLILMLVPIVVGFLALRARHPKS